MACMNVDTVTEVNGTVQPEMSWIFSSPDIMEVIFSHVDGKSLPQCAQVCKLWKELVKNITKNTDIWKKCCKEEINKDTLKEVLAHSSSAWCVNTLKNEDWKFVYKNWRIWQLVGKWPFSIRSVYGEQKFAAVTCMKMSGMFVVTGHGCGSIYLWTPKGARIEIGRHHREVTNLGLIAYSQNLDTNIVEDMSDTKHDYVVSTSRDYSVRINDLRDYESSIVMKSYRVKAVSLRTHERMFAVFTADRYIKLCEVEINEDKLPEVKEHAFFRYAVESVIAINIWDDPIKVIGFTQNGMYIPLYLVNGRTCPTCAQREAVEGCSQEQVAEMDISGRILEAFFWRSDIVILLTDERCMYINVEGHKQVKYNTMPHLHSYPVTVLLYGDVLLLGMESGSIYMYIVNNTTDLLSLKLSEYCWHSSVSKDPIIALDIDNTGGGPCIVAATEKKVLTVTFFPPSLM